MATAVARAHAKSTAFLLAYALLGQAGGHRDVAALVLLLWACNASSTWGSMGSCVLVGHDPLQVQLNFSLPWAMRADTAPARLGD